MKYANTSQKKLKQALAFLKQQKLCVVSTISPNNTPQTALVAYVEDNDLYLYFQTGQHTRKATNLKYNPAISLSVGLDVESGITIQYEGVAMQLAARSDIEECKQRFLRKNSPTTEEYLERSDAIFFKITPTWLRCSDYSQSPHPTIFELNLPKV